VTTSASRKTGETTADFCYNRGMKSKPLSQSNPHLADPQQRRQAILESVASSSAVEGIRLTPQEWQAISKPQPERPTRTSR
jgi:hypothetical protein